MVKSWDTLQASAEPARWHLKRKACEEIPQDIKRKRQKNEKLEPVEVRSPNITLIRHNVSRCQQQTAPIIEVSISKNSSLIFWLLSSWSLNRNALQLHKIFLASCMVIYCRFAFGTRHV